MKWNVAAAAATAVVFTACANPGIDELDDTEPTGKTESAERIDEQNDPNRFQLSLSKVYADLPTTGEAGRKPFPSNWWPMKQAGIAREWLNGHASPTMKYDQLVTPDEIKDVELTLAKKDWEDNPVNEDAQPETLNIGPATEWEHKNHGRYGDTDPEHWYGHCNGWASYVLNEDEPIRPVHVKMQGGQVVECTTDTTGCIEFTLGDINALGGELYWSDGARMLGRRCEEAESDFEMDESGRVTNVECRDGNAGSMHIVATNMLGRLERPFIVDLNADRQVWNFPVYKFELLENREVDLQEALNLIGAPSGTTTWTYNEDAKRFIKVRMKAWIVEDSIPPTTEVAGPLLSRYTTIETYNYILELDANGTIVGGEWTGSSKTDHPDFLWYSFRHTPYGEWGDDRYDRDNPHIRYSHFKKILTFAQQQPASGGGGDDVVTVSANPRKSIPDNNRAGATHTLNVNEAFNVESVRVKVDITHTYRADLVVTLEHGGQTVTLHNQQGGSADDLHINTAVTGFAGASSAGAWTIKVVDTYSQDVGTLDHFGLEIQGDNGGTPPPPPPAGDHVFEVSPSTAIPDNNRTGISSTQNVSDAFTISSLKVSVNITHTYRGDLKVELVHGGKTKVLHANSGGSADNVVETYTVTDWDGTSARGSWVLRVSDHAGADVGTLNSWKLEMTESGGTPPPPPPPNTETVEFPRTPNAAIPDNSAAGVADSIDIDDAIVISELKVEVDISHTYISDLKVVLKKDGVTQTLHANSGGSADDIQEVYSTSAFNSMNLRGRWTLEIVDSARLDIGKLNSWKITATGRRQ